MLGWFLVNYKGNSTGSYKNAQDGGGSLPSPVRAGAGAEKEDKTIIAT